MQYLVVVQTKQEFVDDPPSEVLAKEQARGRELYGSGDLRQSWELDSDRPGVVCLYEAASEDELRSVLDTYPLIQRGIGDVLVMPLKPDSAYVRIA